MKQQKDWYIGTDYYVDYKEKRIQAEELDLTEPLERQLHEQAVVESLVHTAVQEQRRPRFGSQNMVSYLTMQLHILHCRYALERLKDPAPSGTEEPEIWQLIQQIILTTAKPFTLQATARERGVSAGYLNKQIKLASGYTFFQLQKFGKILNACALLHFPELSMEYISGLLHFSNLQNFYRVFRRYMHKSPQEYREQDIFRPVERAPDCGSALLFLQYMHLNFSKKNQAET